MQRFERGTHEQLEADERRDGVTGQAEDERAAGDRERDRLPRLDRNPPEHLVGAERGEAAAHQIVRADRNATGRDEHVVCESALERVARRGRIVGDRLDQLDDRTGGCELRAERDGVRLVDLARPERHARCAQLAARCKDCSTRAARARDVCDARCSERAELRRAEHGSRQCDLLAGAHVASPGPDVCATFRGSDAHTVSRALGDLGGNDGVGTLRDDGAGRDEHRLAGPQLAGKRRPRGRLT